MVPPHSPESSAPEIVFSLIAVSGPRGAGVPSAHSCLSVSWHWVSCPHLPLGSVELTKPIGWKAGLTLMEDSMPRVTRETQG